MARFVRIGGLDAQVAATLVLRSWSVLAGACTVLLIPRWLGQVEQGYYFTFSSLLALQIFFELGLSQVVVQIVSHEFAHLSAAPDGRISGDDHRLAKLAELMRLLRRWYFVAAVAFALAVGAAGAFFFSLQGTLPAGEWLGVWLSVALLTGANLYLSIWLTVLEGCGKVADVARLRTRISVFGYAGMWACLALGASLWSILLLPLTTVVMTAMWLRRSAEPLRDLVSSQTPGAASFSWRRNIFPFQWRIAVSWVSGYFIFQIFTPLTFAKHGPVEAGRLGIAMAIFSALLTVGMSWVNAKLPAMGALVSRSERQALNVLFWSVTKRSLLFVICSVAAVVVGLYVLRSLNPPLASRVADLPVVLCLGIATVANCLVYAAAGYMRIHIEEPMLWVSISSAVATIAAAAFMIDLGVFPMMASYAAVAALLALPWTLRLFATYYRRA